MADKDLFEASMQEGLENKSSLATRKPLSSLDE
jgi:hypothetical protein